MSTSLFGDYTSSGSRTSGFSIVSRQLHSQVPEIRSGAAYASVKSPGPKATSKSKATTTACSQTKTLDDSPTIPFNLETLKKVVLSLDLKKPLKRFMGASVEQYETLQAVAATASLNPEFGCKVK